MVEAQPCTTICMTNVMSCAKGHKIVCLTSFLEGYRLVTHARSPHGVCMEHRSVSRRSLDHSHTTNTRSRSRHPFKFLEITHQEALRSDMGTPHKGRLADVCGSHYVDIPAPPLNPDCLGHFCNALACPQYAPTSQLDHSLNGITLMITSCLTRPQEQPYKYAPGPSHW